MVLCKVEGRQRPLFPEVLLGSKLHFIIILSVFDAGWEVLTRNTILVGNTIVNDFILNCKYHPLCLK